MPGTLRPYGSTVAIKYLMAVTGIVWFLYLLAHMTANLLIYAGPARINSYGHFIHTNPGILWTARVILIVALSSHVIAAVYLSGRNYRCRGIQYLLHRYREADYASRSMLWGGVAIAVFVVYHLLDLTFGTLHPGYVPEDFYDNVVGSFSVGWVAAAYLVGQAALALHLYHGMWSIFQSLGWNHPLYNRWRRVFAVSFAAIIVGGFSSIPIAVLAGAVR
jgi:succinate dehydrogenase / fumarate reductase, cytochrome b subunit